MVASGYRLVGAKSNLRIYYKRWAGCRTWCSVSFGSAARAEPQHGKCEFRGQGRTVLEVVYKAVEHFALHTGQIVYIAKSADTIRLT